MEPLLLILSFVVALVVGRGFVPQSVRAGITGRDVHKPGQPKIAEMGGLCIASGFAAGVLGAVGMLSFLGAFSDVNLAVLLAALAAVLMSALIGAFDDLLGIPQGIKAALPILAAVPLMAVRAGDTRMVVPLVGSVDLWILYPLLVIPSAVTVSANAVNMLAGFNGLEAGLGIVAMGSLSIIAWQLGETAALILLLSGLGALLAILPLNWYPARVFVGDVGTLSIGAVVAAAVIIGDFEVAGLILLIPYGVDFVIKAGHRFPKTFGELRSDGKLHCPRSGPKGLGQLLMKMTGGIHERTLVLLLMGIEAVFGVGAVLLYVLK